jgi:hypothetical protein
MSALTGTVIDGSTRHPLPGVSVTATDMQQRAKTVDTDAAGDYHLEGLESGIYTLQFAMDGYVPYTRDDIELQMNRTIRVNAELLPMGTAGEAGS